MGPRWSISYAFREAVLFVPNDVTPKVPTIFSESERNHPGDADEVLRLQTRRDAHTTPGIALGEGVLSSTLRTRYLVGPIGGISITQIYPEGTVFTENPMNISEHLDEPINVLIWSIFLSKLTGYFIIPKPPVWRRCDAHLCTIIRDIGESFLTIAEYERKCGHSPEFSRGKPNFSSNSRFHVFV